MLVKTEIINKLAKQTGISYNKVNNLYSYLVKDVIDGVKNDGGARLSGLATIRSDHRPARMGHNPATGEQLKIGAKNIASFRTAKHLKEALNK